MGDIDVEGDRNRVAGRDFIEVHMAPGSEPLSPEQRKRLNLLVTNISKDYKVDAWTLWKEVVHTRIGVSNIGEIPKEKFSEAEKSLIEHAEHLHSLAHAKRLVAEVLQIANEQGVYQDLTRYCSREFGVTVLNKLNPEQLKNALRFIETLAQPAAVQPSRAAEELKPEPIAAAKPSRVHFFSEAKSLVLSYPLHCGGVVLTLMILGKLV